MVLADSVADVADLTLKRFTAPSECALHSAAKVGAEAAHGLTLTLVRQAYFF